MNILNKLLSGKMFLLKEPQNVCNLIYIDNLIDILLSVKSHQSATNANFNVSDFQTTWKEFTGVFCKMLSIPIEEIPSISWEEANKSLKKDYIGMAKVAFNEVLKIREVKDLFFSLPFSQKYAVKRRERLDKKLLEANGGKEAETPKLEIEKTFVHLQNCKTVLKCENLTALLKYKPRVDYQTAVSQTRDWLTFNGFIK